MKAQTNAQERGVSCDGVDDRVGRAIRPLQPGPLYQEARSVQRSDTIWFRSMNAFEKHALIVSTKSGGRLAQLVRALA